MRRAFLYLLGLLLVLLVGGVDASRSKSRADRLGEVPSSPDSLGGERLPPAALGLDSFHLAPHRRPPTTKPTYFQYSPRLHTSFNTVIPAGSITKMTMAMMMKKSSSQVFPDRTATIAYHFLITTDLSPAAGSRPHHINFLPLVERMRLFFQIGSDGVVQILLTMGQEDVQRVALDLLNGINGMDAGGGVGIDVLEMDTKAGFFQVYISPEAEDMSPHVEDFMFGGAMATTVFIMLDRRKLKQVFYPELDLDDMPSFILDIHATVTPNE